MIDNSLKSTKAFLDAANNTASNISLVLQKAPNGLMHFSTYCSNTLSSRGSLIKVSLPWSKSVEEHLCTYCMDNMRDSHFVCEDQDIAELLQLANAVDLLKIECLQTRSQTKTMQRLSKLYHAIESELHALNSDCISKDFQSWVAVAKSILETLPKYLIAAQEKLRIKVLKYAASQALVMKPPVDKWPSSLVELVNSIDNGGFRPVSSSIMKHWLYNVSAGRSWNASEEHTKLWKEKAVSDTILTIKQRTFRRGSSDAYNEFLAGNENLYLLLEEAFVATDSYYESVLALEPLGAVAFLQAFKDEQVKDLFSFLPLGEPLTSASFPLMFIPPGAVYLWASFQKNNANIQTAAFTESFSMNNANIEVLDMVKAVWNPAVSSLSECINLVQKM